MVCPKCKFAGHVVVRTEPEDPRLTARRRACPQCQTRWTTDETIRSKSIWSPGDPLPKGAKNPPPVTGAPPPPVEVQPSTGNGGGFGGPLPSDPGPISVLQSDPSSKSGSGARAKSKPAAKDEKARELVAVFCEEWRDAFRMGYVVLPRDANAAKTISKASISPQDWRSAARRYLGSALWGNAQHSLCGLAMNVNGYMVTGDTKPKLTALRGGKDYSADFDAPLSEGPVRR